MRSAVLARVLALAIFAGGIVLRRTLQAGQATLSTFAWMPIFSLPFDGALFLHDLWQNLWHYALGCLGSVWLVLLAVRLWRGADSLGLLAWLKRPWFCPLLAFVLAALLRAYAFHDFEAVTDESGMTFQAQVFCSGHWTAPAPPSPDHFAHPAYKVYQNRWSYIGAPGWPLVLALGRLLAIPNLVPPLLLAATIYLMQRLSRRWHGAEAAAWTGVLALGSPELVLNGACNFGHLATAFWAVAALNCLEEVRPKRFGWCLLSGFCIGMTATTRIVDGTLLCGVLFLWRVVLPPQPYQRPSLAQVLVLVLGLGVGLAPWLAQNLAFTGSPLRTGYEAHGVVGSFLGASLPTRIHLGFLSAVRLLFWACPLLLELTIFACQGRDRRIWFLILLLLSNLLLYAHPEMMGVGARYLLPSLVLLTTFAGSACANLAARAAMSALPAFYLLFVGVAIYPDYIQACSAVYGPEYERAVWLDQVIGPNGIGFLRFDPLNFGMSFTSNRPDLSGPLKVVSLGPDQDAKLAQSFPNRNPVYLDFNPQERRLEVRPFDRSQDDFTRLCGGAHYASEVEKPEEAVAVWSQISEDSPLKAAALANSLKLLKRLGRLEEAEAVEARLKQKL